MKNGNPTFQDMASRPRTVKNVYDRYMELRLVLPGWEYVSEQEILEYLARKAPPEKEKEERTPPTQFVSEWLEKHKDEWKISPMGKRITLLRYGIPIDKDIEDLNTEILVDVYNQSLPYKEGEITRCLSSHFTDRFQRGVSSMFENIQYRPNSETGLNKWLDNLYNWLEPEEDREIFHMMFKHWGWQTKRKILQRQVKYHNWTNLMGASGLGKTTAILKICKPLEDVTSTTTICKLFQDTKEIKRLTENYILIFDELAINGDGEDGEKLNTDQQAVIKSMITGETIDTRVYGTQRQSKKTITFSCISTANTHLYDVIYDPTTMRRFFEFHCQAKATGDFSKISRTLENPEYFWRGIDENNELGYFDPDSPLGLAVAEIQRHYYPTKSSVFDWIKETDARAGARPVWKAYKFYKQYCINCGRKAKAMNSFIDDVKHALPEAIRGETACLDFDITELCRDHKYDGDDPLPEAYDALKPAGLPQRPDPVKISDFI